MLPTGFSPRAQRSHTDHHERGIPPASGPGAGLGKSTSDRPRNFSDE